MTQSTQDQSNGQVPAQEIQKNDKEYNFAHIRAQLEKERASRIEMEQKIVELQKAKAPAANDDDDDSEPYVDHKKLQKKLSAFEKNMDEKIEQKAEMKARSMMEEEKRHSYLRENSDFNNIMSSDVVQKFADKHPKLAETILRMPEGFERQKLVYENIKTLGLDKPEVKQDSIQGRVDANRRHPGYQPSGVASAPYSNGGDFSAGGQKAAYEKLLELKKNLRI